MSSNRQPLSGAYDHDSQSLHPMLPAGRIIGHTGSVLFDVVPGWDGLRMRERQHGDADEQEDRQAHQDLYQAIVGQRYISATIAVAQFRPKM
jgi:hypothetical protein